MGDKQQNKLHNKQHLERDFADPPCGEFADRLVDLSDGELPAAEALVVHEHLAACPACRLTLSRLDRSLGVLADALVSNKPAAAPYAAAPYTTAPYSAEPTVRPASRPEASRRGWRVVLVASAAAAAVALLAIGLNRRPNDSGPGGGNSPPLVHASPEKQAAAVHETPERIARRLALIEQVARLEASLALTPDDPWFAAQRAANERLLAGFRQAVEELSTAADDSQHSPL